MQAWQDKFVNSFQKAFEQLIDVLPNLLASIVVLVIGYLVAKLVARVAETIGERLGLQTAAERSGFSASMQQVGIRQTAPWIVGQVVFWLLMFTFLNAGFTVLGLDAVSQATQEVVSYIPKLLLATFVVIVGLVVATFLRGAVATSADRVGLSHAQRLADACYYVLAVVTFVAAFKQLNIEFELLNDMILIGFGCIAAGFGLALGLGGRDVVGGILAGYYLRQRLESGDRIHVAGMEGTVREIGPVATIIETEEDGLLNRHSVPNGKMLNEAVR